MTGADVPAHGICLHFETGTGKIIASCRCGKWAEKRACWDAPVLMHAYRQHLPWLRWEKA